MSVDRRFGRIPQADPRNKRYPMSLLWRGAEPDIVSRIWTLNERLDQLSDGSCVGHAYAHELLAEPQRVADIDHDDAVFIYHEAQQRDPWPGGAYPGADPFYEGTSTLAGAKVLVDLGYYSGYLWAESEEDIARTISHDGPVVVGVDWYEGMLDTDAAGFVNVTGEFVGGHAVLLVGIDVEGGFYWGVNSWGPHWGLGGMFKIRREDVDRLVFRLNGDAVKPLRVPLDDVPVPEPEDPPAPEPAPSKSCWALLLEFIKRIFGG